MRRHGMAVRAATILPLLLVPLLSCGSDEATGPVIAERMLFGVTFDNRLIRFSSNNPGQLLSELLITGVPTGQRIVSIDFRPADGELYGVGTDNVVYHIAKVTGTATAVAGAFTPSLDGTHFGLSIGSDDRIRTSSVESNQNLRLNPTDGTVSGTDGTYAYAAGDVHAGTNPSVAALANRGSTFYGIESVEDVLVRISNPASGELTTIGDLGISTVPCTAFDIDQGDGLAFASLASDGISRLALIDLTTGSATFLGTISVSSEVQGLAIEE